jgi:cell division protein ZapB
MESDLIVLEERIARLIGLFQQLRTENIQLRQELAQAQDEVRQLKENMTLAGTRLQTLLEQLPEDAS